LSDIADKVTTWLSTTGFPLEMSAASAFLAAGFEVTQSYIYEDPESEKAREMDVFARDPDYIGIIDIAFIAECKSSTNPWVVMLPMEGPVRYNKLLSFALTSEPARVYLSERLLDRPLPEYIEDGAARGYSLRQAFARQEDVAFSAAFGLLKASTAATKEIAITQVPRHAFAFPLLVVDAPLFECIQLSNGQLQVTEVESSSFLFVNNIPERRGCRITIITKSHLATFARKAKDIARAIRADFEGVQAKY
jgi:hypothetical protein